jgi:predicted nucleic acid-binding protein
MARVAFDSTIIITLDGGPCSLPRGKERAESLLEKLRKGKDEVVIPAPAFAECCHCAIDDLKAFKIMALNGLGGNLANKLMPAMRAVTKKKKGCTRCNASLDALILACAETTGCAVLYTLDGWFYDVAVANNLRIRVIPTLPDVSAKQLPLRSAVVNIDAGRKNREPA